MLNELTPEFLSDHYDSIKEISKCGDKYYVKIEKEIS